VKAWEKDLEHDPDDWRVDIGEVEQTIMQFCQTHNVREIACDPFRWQRSMEVLENKGLPVVAFPQSPQRMIKACAKFLRFCGREACAPRRGSAFVQAYRQHRNQVDACWPAHQRRKTQTASRKIDAAVAAILALDRASAGKIEEVVPEFFG
jgi:phage terminase large subunit-like protein